ncbi:MAG TPA: hypothetical protein VMN36_06080 [Verrucomicrobiales bacterium]|nr:hypothetical protein [Verrucomicrobiales bacterium]
METPTPTGPASELPPSLVRQLERLRSHLWRVKISQALCTSLAAIFCSFLLLFASDRLWNTPPAGRLFLFLGGLVVFGLLIPWALQHWVLRHQRFLALSRFVQKTWPRLGDRLQGVIELASDDNSSFRASASLKRAALRQVAEETSSIDLNKTVPVSPLRRWAIVGSVLALLTLAALMGTPRAASNSLARWFQPLSDIERYTFTQTKPLPSKRVVPIGEAFTVALALEEDSPWKPSRAIARLPGQPKRVSASQEGVFPFELPGQTENKSLRLRVGDARHRIDILPATRPELTSLLGRVQLPAYLGYPEQEIDLRRGAADVLAGSTVVYIGTVSRALRNASLTASPVRSIPVRGSTFESGPVAVEAHSQSVILEWEDSVGLGPREPFTVRITPLEDRPPSGDAQNLGRVVALLEEDTLTLDLLSRDDFGVKEVGILWETAVEGDVPPLTQGSALARIGSHLDTELPASVSFQPKAYDVGPQKLHLWVYSVDYLPGREPSRSAPYTIFVLDRAQHAQLIQQEFGKLRDSLEEIARVEESLNETNRELADLDPSELSQPENQQRLAQQEEGEERNSRALDRLSEQGQELFQEAVKNEDIDPAALEQWSQMLSTMQEVAGQDMPQVAASLSQSQQSAAAGRSSQSQQQLSEALAKQQEILEKLGQAMDQAGLTAELLEASTFINRLRKAARDERTVGAHLEEAILQTVGMMPEELEDPDSAQLQRVEEQQKATGQEAGWIQEDLGHFYARTGKAKYQEVHQAMREAKVMEEMTGLTAQIRQNQAGRSIADTRLWAERFNAWADMLTPEDDGGGGGGGEGGGQPNYELLLAIMRIVQKEMDIRNQTRSLDATREGNPEYTTRSRALAGEQMLVGKDIHDLMEAYPIPMLHQILGQADRAVADATGLLNRPDTGGETVAAETEVIEILANASQSCCGAGASAGMMAMMQMMMGMSVGQSPGGNPGGGLSDRANDDVAGDAEGGRAEDRSVQKASGRSLSEFPAEFREALGKYFEAVEQIRP